MTIEIKLSKGKVALVDDVDADLGNMRWYVNDVRTSEYAIGHPNVDGKRLTVQLHRVIMERVLDRPLTRGEKVDHKDGNGLNNQRYNLRVCQHKENIRNSQKRKHTTSRYKGVYQVGGARSKPWGASITVDGVQYYLGTFATELEAHRTYCLAALTHHKDFANFGDTSPYYGWGVADFNAPDVHVTQPTVLLANELAARIATLPPEHQKIIEQAIRACEGKSMIPLDSPQIYYTLEHTS